MAFAAFRNRFIVPAAGAWLCAVVASTASAAPQSPAAPSNTAVLDQSRIHSYYTDGEFDKVIKDLESFLKSRRACSHAESVFVAKHLSVVYAAHPGTRELGRYHMFRLLDLSPGTDLLDMFVGDEVGGVFEKVGKEYALRNPSKVPMRKSAAVNSAPAAMAAPATNVKAPASAPRKAATPPDNRIKALVDSRPVPVPETRVDPVRSAVPARPASPALRPPVAKRLPSPKVPASSAGRIASRDSAASPRKAAIAEPARPAWKEPGLWIGGGAAFAVVAFTLFYSGSDDAPAGKTYVVPATAAR